MKIEITNISGLSVYLLKNHLAKGTVEAVKVDEKYDLYDVLIADVTDIKLDYDTITLGQRHHFRDQFKIIMSNDLYKELRIIK